MALPPENEIDWDALMRDMAPPEWDFMLSAAAKNELDRVRDFIQNQGVPPSHGNGIGQTALHISALWGHTDVVRYLVQAGADVNAANRLNGATPLHVALQSSKTTPEKQVELVRILMQEGNADPLLEDSYGKCPIQYVMDTQHPLHRNNNKTRDDDTNARSPHADLVERMIPPPMGVDRIRAGFLNRILSSTPSCPTAK